VFIQRCVVANVLKGRLIFSSFFLSFSECERRLFEITSDGLFDSFSGGSFCEPDPIRNDYTRS
jgi:hypothetical protein